MTRILLCAAGAWFLSEAALRGQAAPANPPAPAAPAAGTYADYRIGPGDVLQVSVFKEPDASADAVLVRADGKITLPLLKEVEVSNLTTTELQRVLQEKLIKYIPAPDVTVIVRESNSKKVYLVGAVKKEGAVTLKYPMTILQVLSEAGGLTEYAKKRKIYLLRVQSGKQYRIPFDYTAVVKGEKTEQNIVVQPGDTIVVPQ